MDSAHPFVSRLFTSRDFEEMMVRGAFEDMRVELVGGVLEKMAPSHGDHGSTNGDLYADLRQAYRGCPVWLAVDLAIRINGQEVRGADVAVAHENTPKDQIVEGRELLLVVEVVKSTQARDLVEKPVSYATAGVPEYWAVDLKSRMTRVFTEPGEDGYARYRDVPFGEPITPPGANEAITIA